jgi:hypothetical protein
VIVSSLMLGAFLLISALRSTAIWTAMTDLSPQLSRCCSEAVRARIVRHGWLRQPDTCSYSLNAATTLPTSAPQFSNSTK